MRSSSLPVRIPTLFPGHPTQLGSAQAGLIAVFEVWCLMFSECVYKIHSKVTYRLLRDYLMFGIFPVTVHSHSFTCPFIKTCVKWSSMSGSELGSGEWGASVSPCRSFRIRLNTVRCGVGWHLKKIPWERQWGCFLGGQGPRFSSWRLEAMVYVCVLGGKWRWQGP